MTGFVIDTGSHDPMRGAWRVERVQIIADHARDAVGFDAAPEVYHAEVAKLIRADVMAPKKAETARAHFLALWPLIAPMAREAPASFDFILQEFAEHLDGFR
jgi:hypothetical protein